MNKSVKSKLLKRVRGTGRGYVFSAKDFLDLGSRPSVDKALSELVKEQAVRRVGRGLYYYPRKSKLLEQELSPDLDQVARALARKSGQRIEPAGAWAANLLGLSSQVPARAVYLTDGRTRTVSFRNHKIQFTHVEPKQLVGRRRSTNLVIQALRHLGRDRINETTIQSLRQRFDPKTRRALANDAKYSTDWVYDVIKRVAVEEVA